MKERIINCSIELFGRYGIKGVTMAPSPLSWEFPSVLFMNILHVKSNCSKSVCILGWTSIGYLY